MGNILHFYVRWIRLWAQLTLDRFLFVFCFVLLCFLSTVISAVKDTTYFRELGHFGCPNPTLYWFIAKGSRKGLCHNNNRVTRFPKMCPAGWPSAYYEHCTRYLHLLPWEQGLLWGCPCSRTSSPLTWRTIPQGGSVQHGSWPGAYQTMTAKESEENTLISCPPNIISIAYPTSVNLHRHQMDVKHFYSNL